MRDEQQPNLSTTLPRGHVEPLAYPIEDVPAVAGVTRTRIFAAVKNKELTARKAGRATIIEADELRRWIKSLPTRGRAG